MRSFAGDQGLLPGRRGHDPVSVGADHLGQLRLARTFRDRGDGPGQNVVKALDGTLDAQLGDGVGATMQIVLPGGFAKCRGIAERVAQVVGDLERLADAGAEFLPWSGS